MHRDTTTLHFGEIVTIVGLRHGDHGVDAYGAEPVEQVKQAALGAEEFHAGGVADHEH